MSAGSIHFVTGIGNSLCCRLSIEYLEKKKLDLIVVDLDSLGSIAKTYSIHNLIPSITNSKLELFPQGDLIFELAFEGKTIVINSPSSEMEKVHNWFRAADILNLSHQLNVKIWQWLTIDGSLESIELLKKSYQLYGDSIFHIVVKNNKIEMGNSFKWCEELQSYLQISKKTYFLTMPQIPIANYCWNTIVEQRLTLSQAKSKSCSSLTITNKQAIHTWLKMMFQRLSLIPIVQHSTK